MQSHGPTCATRFHGECTCGKYEADLADSPELHTLAAKASEEIKASLRADVDRMEQDRATNLCRTLAQLMVGRVTTLGLKGKKADDEACAFFSGAATMAHIEGQEVLAQHLGRVTSLLIAVRGMAAVRQIAAGT